MLERKVQRKAKIAFFCVGHSTYWGQFEGLLESLLLYHGEAKKLIAQNDVEIVDYGMVDSNQKAYDVSVKINGENPDLIVCDMITYATSSTFTPIIQNANAPVILVALQPLECLDYTKANTFMQLQNDNICSVPEFMCAAERLNKKIADVIIGKLYDDERAQAAIAEWCDIAKVLNGLKGARIALMGHVMEAMYDMHCDPAAITSAFGVHVPLIEIDSLVALAQQVTEEEIEEKCKLICAEFDMPEPKQDPLTMKLTEKDLYVAARSAVALDKLVEKYNLNGMAYYYEGVNDESEQRKMISSLIVGNSILNAQGTPMCGEFDIKTCVAMYIMDKLDIGGSFAEFHPFDFKGNYILVGHDGPHHLRVADGKPVLRSLKKYHGKPGGGASVEFKLKEGPITLLGITQKGDGSFKFVVGEGRSEKGAIPPTGNTNTRGFFYPSAPEFLRAWVMEAPTHHLALGIGHKANVIKKIADILGIECVIVNEKLALQAAWQEK